MSAGNSRIEIRPVWPEERQRAMRLFQIPYVENDHLHLFAAVRHAMGPDRLLACLALQTMDKCEEVDVSLGRVFWRCVPALQGSEVERHLLQTVSGRLTELGISGVSTQETWKSDAPEVDLLQEAGFEVFEKLEDFQAPFDTVWARLQRAHAHLQKRRAIPDGVEFAGLDSPLLKQARAIFHNQMIINAIDFDRHMHPDHPRAYDVERSTLIGVNGELIGAIIMAPAREGNGYLVPGRWVARGYRNSWANVALIHHSVKRCVELNLDFFHFLANTSRHRETLCLARKMGGDLAESRLRFALRPDQFACQK